MRWPPNKAWTSSKSIEGYRHFEVIEYGGKGDDRWVTLVAILDREIKMKIDWNELKTYSKWSIGWMQLDEE